MEGKVTLTEAYNRGLISDGAYLDYPVSLRNIEVDGELNGYGNQPLRTLLVPWRVFKDNEKFFMFSEEPVAEKLILFGKKGHENSIEIMKSVLETLYGTEISKDIQPLNLKAYRWLQSKGVISQHEFLGTSCWLADTHKVSYNDTPSLLTSDTERKTEFGLRALLHGRENFHFLYDTLGDEKTRVDNLFAIIELNADAKVELLEETREYYAPDGTKARPLPLII